MTHDDVNCILLKIASGREIFLEYYLCKTNLARASTNEQVVATH